MDKIPNRVPLSVTEERINRPTIEQYRVEVPKSVDDTKAKK